MNVLSIVGRTRPLFVSDVQAHDTELRAKISGSRILVIGGAGTIGQAVTRELFKRDPKALHVVDLSENNLVELVRDIRSTLGYGTGDFQTVRGAFQEGNVAFPESMIFKESHIQISVRNPDCILGVFLPNIE